ALAMTVLMVAPLGYATWREAFSVLAAASIVIALAAIVWNMRGLLIERVMDFILRRVSPEPILAKTKSDTHHVICATEAQLGETLYFAQHSIRVRGHTPYAADLPTARIVRASAAFPLAFPPVFLRGVPVPIVSSVPMADGSSLLYGPVLM